MAYAFEIGDELPDPPTLAEVESDIADWKARLADLMTLLTQWAQEIPDVEVELGPHDMRERKMALVGIDTPVQLPSLLIRRVVEVTRTPMPEAYWTPYTQELVKRREAWLSVMPDARWVVGTRGQVLIRAFNRFETVMDLGEVGRPDWRIFRLSDHEFVPFTKTLFQDLVKALK
ncbi:MAG: hypothetical protein JHC88_00485 [Niveispirillum sp.]|nr:hypothetical protein [Niveispirillum sp.]